MKQDERFNSILDIFPYGAPELRRSYNKYLTWGMGAAIGLYALGIGGWIQANSLGEEIIIVCPGPGREIFIESIPILPIDPTPTQVISVTQPGSKANIGVPIPVPPQIQLSENIEWMPPDGVIQVGPNSGSDSGAGQAVGINTNTTGVLPGLPIEIEPVEDTFEIVSEYPVVAKQVEPVYPRLAVQAQIEGKVYVRVLVGKDGRVKAAEIFNGPEVFHDAALEAAKQWVFTPGIQGNRPVNVWVMIPFKFELE